MKSKTPVAIILAAGKGTRLKAKGHNKVVYPLNDKPMVAYTVDHLRTAGFFKIVVVVGFAQDSVQSVLHDTVSYAVQKKRLGTGKALQIGIENLPPDFSPVLSLYGDDSAFYPPALFTALLHNHLENHALMTVLTIHRPHPQGLGRIIRDQNHHIIAIVEEKNATPEQKQITEINTGLYCFDRDFLATYLPRIKKNRVSGEYYLTDLVSLAVADNLKVNDFTWSDPSVWQGVNTKQELQTADNIMRQKVSI